MSKLKSVVGAWMWPYSQKVRAVLAAGKVRHLTSFRAGRPHGLPGPLIVSLTSYPKRFATLHLTLKALLDQDTRADRVILWLTPAELEALPARVRELRDDRFEVRTHPADLRSYKKIVPALIAFPGAFIVTADDDLYYPPDWLGAMTRLYRPDRPAIICHRAHLPQYDGEGRLRPYSEWVWDVSECPEGSLFPTGGAGALYPPGSLDTEAVDEQRLMELAPHADDVWLFFMGHRARSRYRKVPGKFRLLVWPGSQATALMHANLDDNQNDVQIRRMEEHFGLVGQPRDVHGEMLPDRRG